MLKWCYVVKSYWWKRLFALLFNIYAVQTNDFRKSRRIAEMSVLQRVLIVIFLTLWVSEVVYLFLQKLSVFAAVMCLFLQCRCCKAAKNALKTLKWLSEPMILADWADGFGHRSDFDETFIMARRVGMEKNQKNQKKKWKLFWINNTQK